MRTDKELLEFLLKEFTKIFNKHYVYGLCDCVRLLSASKEEKTRLIHILDLNPTEYYENCCYGYYFIPRAIEPRQEYLKQLIEKYK
jgi:hypothetical protein